MNGAHDLGGLDGFGPVMPEPVKPVFHHDWEKRAFALTIATGFLGRWNIDASRYARENTDPLTYLRSTYYEQWLRGLERLLVERGLVSPAELKSGRALGPSELRAPRAGDVPAILAKGSPAGRASDRPPAFTLGQQVRVKNLHPKGHTRMPRYCRGHVGTVVRDHGAQVFPDSNARFAGEDPRRCYAVRFAARELWGPEASDLDSVVVDLWEPYLEQAT
jgi:nitrile hydratase